MKLSFKAAIAAAVVAVSGTVAHAADWTPPGPIKMVIAFAAFQSSQVLGDLAALLAIGSLGILLRRFG